MQTILRTKTKFQPNGNYYKNICWLNDNINSRVVKSMTITIFMDVKEMYTVLSRTTKLEYIHLRNNQLCKRYSERKRNSNQMAIITKIYAG